VRLPQKFQAPSPSSKRWLQGIKPSSKGKGVDVFWHDGFKSFVIENCHENIVRCQIGSDYDYFFGKGASDTKEMCAPISEEFYK